MDVDGLNTGYAQDLLEEYLENPDAVPSEWRHLFESGSSNVVASYPGLARLLELLCDGNGPIQVEVEVPAAGPAAPPPQPVTDEVLRCRPAATAHCNMATA